MRNRRSVAVRAAVRLVGGALGTSERAVEIGVLLTFTNVAVPPTVVLVESESSCGLGLV